MGKWLKVDGYNYIVNDSGEVKSLRTNSLISGYVCNGYLKYDLYRNSERRRVYAHQLVCETFLKDTHFKGAVVNHKDGNKSNNSTSNLEWTTYSLNNKHAYDVLGKKCVRPKGANSIHAKAVLQLDCNGKFLNKFATISEAVEKYGGCVEKCLYGRNKTAYGFKWMHA